MGGEAERTQNALSSDSKEELDGSLINRYIAGRVAKLRRKLAFALKPGNATMTATPAASVPERINFDLLVPDKFTYEQLSAMSELMHEYVVKGAILDWYQFTGIAPTVSKEELELLESAIVSTLRVGFTHRPLQPFGPRK
jgi:hypothetical protein